MLARTFFAFSVALFAVSPSESFAQASAQHEDALARELSGFESAPRAAQWRARGTEVITPLASLALDRQRPSFVRVRAATALGAFQGASAREALHAIIQHAHRDEPLLLRAALEALARSAGRDALSVLANHAGHPDIAVREGVIVALTELRGSDAHRVLRERTRAERSPALRARISLALKEQSAAQ